MTGVQFRNVVSPSKVTDGELVHVNDATEALVTVHVCWSVAHTTPFVSVTLTCTVTVPAVDGLNSVLGELVEE